MVCLQNIGVRALISRGEGGEPFAQKILTSYPNFYETVEGKRESYDALMAYIFSRNINLLLTKREGRTG